MIPGHVYIELSSPGVDHLRRQVDMLLNSGVAVQISIELDTKAYIIYRKLTSHRMPGIKLSVREKLQRSHLQNATMGSWPVIT